MQTAQLVDLPVHRHATRPLIGRAFDLRANVSPYDAVYVALAEGLACALLTADVRLCKAPGPSCEVHIITA